VQLETFLGKKNCFILMGYKVMQKVNYRESHSAPGYGDRYDRNYSSGYYAAVFRDLEVPILERLFEEFGSQGSSLLDFACGTGRITAVACRHLTDVSGVDVSEEMLVRARTACSAEFIKRDITKEGLGKKYSLITAFRFFLNADEPLRIQALTAIREHLSEDGYLICNIHMNSHSLVGLVYRFGHWIPGVPKHNTLSHKKFVGLLRRNGFEVQRTIWYAALPRPGRFFPRIMDWLVAPAEKIFKRFGLSQKLSHSFMIVAKRS
jgi:SAM-dependent methyltransferase